MKEYSWLDSRLMPSNHDLRQWAGGLADQENTNSCVANAITSGLELLKTRQGQPVELSRLFLYYNARMISGIAYDMTGDFGSRPYSAISSIAAFGVPDESDWAFNVQEVNTKPPQNVYEKAKQGNRTHLNAEVILPGMPPGATVASMYFHRIRSAISEGFPVAIQLHASTTMWYQSGPLSTHQYTPCWINESLYQGVDHEMLVVGYTPQYLILENSYGPESGDGGYHALPLQGCGDISNAFVLRAFDGYTFLDERAAIIRQPNIVKEYVNSLLTQGKIQEVIDDCVKYFINDMQLEFLMGWTTGTVRKAKQDTEGSLNWNGFLFEG